MGGHRDLVAWQKAMKLVRDVYRCTSEFPKHEVYGLASQLRRAAVSIPATWQEEQIETLAASFTNWLERPEDLWPKWKRKSRLPAI